VAAVISELAVVTVTRGRLRTPCGHSVGPRLSASRPRSFGSIGAMVDRTDASSRSSNAKAYALVRGFYSVALGASCNGALLAFSGAHHLRNLGELGAFGVAATTAGAFAGTGLVGTPASPARAKLVTAGVGAGSTAVALVSSSGGGSLREVAVRAGLVLAMGVCSVVAGVEGKTLVDDQALG